MHLNYETTRPVNDENLAPSNQLPTPRNPQYVHPFHTNPQENDDALKRMHK